MKNNPLTIYCPKCNKKVATWDGRTTMNLVAKCVTCRKLVVFTPETKATTYKNLPFRATSSGKTFI